MSSDWFSTPLAGNAFKGMSHGINRQSFFSRYLPHFAALVRVMQGNLILWGSLLFSL
jgi:hypothetical protein